MASGSGGAEWLIDPDTIEITLEQQTMNRDEVLAFLTHHRAALRQLGVKSLALFGSVARAEATANSDIDILVDLEQPVTFDQYMDIKFYLEDHLKASVDLVTWKSLRPQLRSTVEQEAIHVA